MEKIVVKNLVENGKHFCVLPWVHFHAWPDGKVMPCCIADSDMPVGEIKSDETIIDMMNSEPYKEIRTAMMKDEPVSACKRCYDLELMGEWTMRQSHNMRRGLDYVDYIADVTNDDGSLKEFQMKYMDIRFSNICNMKCRSCGPSCSSLWSAEFLENRGKEVFEEYFPKSNGKIVINNNDDQTLMAKLKPYLDDVTEVYFAGGEIIITPEHYECLDYWVENGLTDQVELTYTTNFSTLSYKKSVDLMKYWKQFPQLKIWASLDAHGKVAECIRSGTDWDRIVRNIREVKEQVPHAEFQITPTISIWNIFDFPDFWDYMVDNDFIDVETSSPRFNLATNPWYANIMILPQSTKRRLAELYRVYQERHKDNHAIYNGFKMIIYNLTVGDENKGGVLEFKKFNEELDSYRDEKFEDIVPGIKEVYEWAES
jgi:hypothetical protein